MDCRQPAHDCQLFATIMSVTKNGTKNQQYCLNAQARPNNIALASQLRRRRCHAISRNARQMISVSRKAEKSTTVSPAPIASTAQWRQPTGESHSSHAKSAQ